MKIGIRVRSVFGTEERDIFGFSVKDHDVK